MKGYGLPTFGVVLAGLAWATWAEGLTMVTLLLSMGAWLFVGTWGASRWVGIIPPPLEDLDDSERWPAVQAFQGLQAAANVARWRRVVVVMGLVGIVLVWDRAEDKHARCELRASTRVEYRSAIGAGVDAGLGEGGVGLADRERIGRAVTDAVARELPPPHC